ncbi:WbqC family protein [Aestuariibaculum sp. YM273]|uniref:WbqC family protein n=1 Tax=Aestuariibaculum sp. YM273 TaxID=3070659 RepID=UPI0027DE0A59|nr:WbqC family protein [Aestuariibaculum sp. YM273]WMI65840.1 WbqC family protein [Aestuariibaculum sp. YM273]
MNLGIMQPYFLPYLGYFALINYVDEFILFDTPQFIRHGWIERNRILKLNGEPFYFKVPLEKHSREIPIQDIRINNNIHWKKKILAQITHYKKHASYYNEVVELLEFIFDQDYTSIVSLNHRALKVICSYLEITTPIFIWSQMNIEISPATKPDEWALNISKAKGANCYTNLPGGNLFFDKKKYSNASINLEFLEINSRAYKQFGNEFVFGLSIIDVLLFNSKANILNMLNDFTILK